MSVLHCGMCGCPWTPESNAVSHKNQISLSCHTVLLFTRKQGTRFVHGQYHVQCKFHFPKSNHAYNDIAIV